MNIRKELDELELEIAPSPREESAELRKQKESKLKASVKSVFRRMRMNQSFIVAEKMKSRK
ncbi:MAG TPA: hypothetical protein VE988_22400 [Gemmataceae bacterium]|nr:hypothetical protein [Gemmataceae bacterium]